MRQVQRLLKLVLSEKFNADLNVVGEPANHYAAAADALLSRL
jgi:hypothetical protein